MKIRHKQSGVVLEGQFTNSLGYFPTEPPHRYWLSGEHSRYDHNEWEEVKPELSSKRYEGLLWADILEDLSQRLDRLERQA